AAQAGVDADAVLTGAARRTRDARARVGDALAVRAALARGARDARARIGGRAGHVARGARAARGVARAQRGALPRAWIAELTRGAGHARAGHGEAAGDA